MQHEKLERAAAPRRGGRLAVRAHHPAQDQTQVVRGIDRDEDVDRLVRRGGADLQATRRERHGESSYAHVLLAFLFLTDDKTTARLSSAASGHTLFFQGQKSKNGFFINEKND